MPDQEIISSNNRRIAKNTLALYLRMFLSMAIGLYTSRVVLATLGVDDYGIYGVVGGVVAMLSFLNASMSGATSRFLTFELGRGEQERLKKTFSSALIIHIGIALVVLVFAETVGLWFLCNKLVIPEGRMTAAHWVYQMSIASAMLGITQVPYNATIIAHERMGVYAYVEILNSVLKLVIVYLLVIGNFDKLILYSVLMFAVSAIIISIYRIYCLRNFKETHFHWVWDKNILVPMLSFSGWDLYGNFSVTVRQQGLNFLINIFFGVVYNAASSVASTISGLVKGFGYNIIQAFRPQIIKYYACDDVDNMQVIVRNALQYSILLYGCMLVPLVIEMPKLIELWLGVIPEASVVFCRLLLLAGMVATVNNVIVIVIHATGRIKLSSFVTGSLYVLTVPAVYLAFELNCWVDWTYKIFLAANILILISNIAISKHLVSMLKLNGLFWAILKGGLVVLIGAVASYFIHLNYEEGFVRIVLVTLANIVVIGVITYCFVLSKEMRTALNNKICRIFR